jgi:predicted ABC-type ATPase
VVEAKKVIIIAGPDGAGKTTFAREFLPLDAACPTFINGDLRAVPAALERAYLRAREVARQTDTFLVVVQNGQMVKLKVN